jgi:hypothetical protein
MAQHPDDRPASVEAFRQLLFPASTAVGPSRTAWLPELTERGTWIEALRPHAWLLAAALFLTVLALVVTLFPPTLLPGITNSLSGTFR